MRSFFLRHPITSFFLVAFIVRALCLLVFPLPDLSGSDFPYYEGLARSLIEHGDFGGVTNVAPGWPFILAVLYLIFGAGDAVVVMFSLCISALVVACVGALTRELFGVRAAFIAGGILSLWPPAIIDMFAYGNSNGLYVLLFVVTVFLGVLSVVRRQPLWAAMAGIIFGFAVLIDSSGLFLPLCLLCALVVVCLKSPRSEMFSCSVVFRYVLFFVIPYVLVVGAWTLRNIHVFEGLPVTPIVAKDTDLRFVGFGDTSIYGEAWNRASVAWKPTFFAVGRFFFIPHNLLLISSHSQEGHRDMVKEAIFKKDISILTRGGPIFVVKVFITLLHVALVFLFILSVCYARPKWFGVVVIACIGYGLFGSIVFGLVQERGIVDIEPISRFFFPYVPLMVVIASVFFTRRPFVPLGASLSVLKYD